MKQFEVRWARLPEPIGLRPVLLLTRTPGYRYLTRVVVAEVTTRVRSIPQEVLLGVRDGMPKKCAAKLENIHLVPTTSVGALMTTLRAERIVEIKRALGHMLAWPELMAL